MTFIAPGVETLVLMSSLLPWWPLLVNGELKGSSGSAKGVVSAADGVVTSSGVNYYWYQLVQNHPSLVLEIESLYLWFCRTLFW